MGSLSRFRDGLPRLEVCRQRDPVLEGHVHGHLELNYLFAGALRYRLGGRRVQVPTGRWALFWAALPHALEGSEPGSDVLALAVPVGTVLIWPEVEPLQRRLMAGELLVLPGDPADAVLAERWCREASDPRRLPLVLLEVEALVRRAALALGEGRPAPAAPVRPLSRAFGTMIELLHRHPATPRSLAEVARHAGMRPDTASRLFRRCAGCSIRGYQQRLRVAEARRLLTETTQPILEVALRCGYQSLSRFYAAYTRVFGEAPAACRRRLAR